jgi:hypothetical protein
MQQRLRGHRILEIALGRSAALPLKLIYKMLGLTNL